MGKLCKTTPYAKQLIKDVVKFIFFMYMDFTGTIKSYYEKTERQSLFPPKPTLDNPLAYFCFFLLVNAFMTVTINELDDLF
jgi:hypothetical protein